LPRAIGPADSIPAKPGQGNANRGADATGRQDAARAGAYVIYTC
jgi:hypothetical protein